MTPSKAGGRRGVKPPTISPNNGRATPGRAAFSKFFVSFRQFSRDAQLALGKILRATASVPAPVSSPKNRRLLPCRSAKHAFALNKRETLFQASAAKPARRGGPSIMVKRHVHARAQPRIADHRDGAVLRQFLCATVTFVSSAAVSVPMSSRATSALFRFPRENCFSGTRGCGDRLSKWKLGLLLSIIKSLSSSARRVPRAFSLSLSTCASAARQYSQSECSPDACASLDLPLPADVRNQDQ